MSNPLPIFIKLVGRPCVIVGGGPVAARKAQQLLKAGAVLTVIAPALIPALEELRETGALVHRAREYTRGDLEGCVLVFAATDDSAVNQAVSRDAQERGIPVNVADQPELCTFLMPSIVDRSPVQIAISTGGASPVLARLLKARLETYIPAAYGHLASLMAQFRDSAKRKFPDMNLRRRFWEKVLHGPVAEMLFAGQEQAAAKALAQQIDDEAATPQVHGEVYLVGAGPGDPDLLSFRALRLMQQAEVVLYDRLINSQLLDLIRKDAERIYVGKERSHHSVPQENINNLLVELAQAGKRVLRLKGGDPFIFGRGGEEIETLAAQGIPFQVVPGITAASGCAAYAGIPLTHRDYAQSVVFVTGYLKDGSVDLNWDLLTQPMQTIVVYMGMQGLAILCRELIAHGLSAATPAAVVVQGTTPEQRVYTATLNTLPAMMQPLAIKQPSLIIIGDVVRLHEKLAWYRPLPAIPVHPG
jgi:uroporphyrin-III C-methyltransferase/precorrin-2 dehydrogenase/sirohydrochlorin ferrochelatase